MRFEVFQERRKALTGNLRFPQNCGKRRTLLQTTKMIAPVVQAWWFFCSTTAYNYPIIIERTIHVRFGRNLERKGEAKMDTRISLLIVDDERAVRQLLIRGFEGQHYRIAEASNGRSALRKLRTTKFDIVISDISMPKMDGLRLLVEIKRDYPDAAVILISGYPEEYCDQDVLNAGADCYITKPFENEDIFRPVNRLHDFSR
jgi:CheY-like chemotaxis protein